MEFIVLNLETGYSQWLSYWNKLDNKEVYAHPDYLRLYEDSKTEANCAIFSTEETLVMYPFFKRDLSVESFYNSSLGEIYDIVTPYGYGGGIVSGNCDLSSNVKQFYSLFNDWALENNIICEFIRFYLDSTIKDHYVGEVEYNNDNIIVDLTQMPEDRWKSYKPKVRKNVNKALRSNITIEIDINGDRIDDFLGIYYSTMDRRSASDGYYFSELYFKSINSTLDGQYVYFHAFCEGVMVSTELVLVSDDNIYSFLGGTKQEFFDLRVNDLLKHKIMDWGYENNKKSFILGGGYTQGDGIYSYKEAFAPYGKASFFIGKQILNNEIYNKLVSIRKSDDESFDESSSFFPLYRS